MILYFLIGKVECQGFWLFAEKLNGGGCALRRIALSQCNLKLQDSFRWNTYERTQNVTLFPALVIPQA